MSDKKHTASNGFSQWLAIRAFSVLAAAIVHPGQGPEMNELLGEADKVEKFLSGEPANGKPS